VKLTYNIPLFATLLLIFSIHPIQGEENDQTESITVRGEIVVLNESGHPLPPTGEEARTGGRLALRSSNGNIYEFSISDPKAAMFVDPRIQKRYLQVAGWLRNGYLEVIRVHSVHGGKLFDLYYRCEVCNITSYEPGPCWCCQDDFEFRETPVDKPIPNDDRLTIPAEPKK